MEESDSNEVKLAKVVNMMPDAARNCALLNCYTFGSRVYGNYTKESDYDYKVNNVGISKSNGKDSIGRLPRSRRRYCL
jgi:hypothetical protein